MPFARAEKFVAECRATAGAACGRCAREYPGPVSGCCVLTASGRPLPGLVGILASHALIHSAEGEFYRDAVAEACARAKIAVSRVRERDVLLEAEHLAGWRERLVEFGKAVGPPWTQDEKLSALGAWLVLRAKAGRR